MSEKNNSVAVQILDRTYQFKCKLEEAETLKDAAAHLDAKMREIHDNGGAVGYERTAMVAAIDVCFELISMRAENSAYHEEINGRVKNLQEKVANIIESAKLDIPKQTLGEQQDLEL
jgi:cell division protein ZapA